MLIIEVVTEESDQGLIVNDDNEPAGPSTAVNKGKALAGDEVEPFRQERGPEDLPVSRFPLPLMLITRC
jgi:hypothetical protein